MSHTFKAPNGTVFNFNGDMSGDVHAISPNERQSWIDGYDLTAFQSHLASNYGNAERMAETMADYEAEVQMRIEEHAERKWQEAADRERIEFIRRAAIAFSTEPSTYADSTGARYCAGVSRCWELAKALWDARPDDC